MSGSALDLVPPDLRSVFGLHRTALAARHGSSSIRGRVSRSAGSCWHRRTGNPNLGLHANLIAPEVLPLGGPHLRHRRVGFGVVVIGVPEKKADAALLLRDLDLHFHILR